MNESSPNKIEVWMLAFLDIPPGERIAALAAFHALLNTLQDQPLPEPQKRVGRPKGSRNRKPKPPQQPLLDGQIAESAGTVS